MSQDSKLQSFIANPNISLWKLTIPMAVGLFVNSIYILVDTYFLAAKLNICYFCIRLCNAILFYHYGNHFWPCCWHTTIAQYLETR